MPQAAELAPPVALTYAIIRRRFTHRLTSLTALATFLGPGRGICPRCRRAVLVVMGEVPLEPIPVMQQHPCPTCEQVRGNGHIRRRPCVRCRNTGLIGEPLPLRGVAIDQDGIARPFRGGSPLEGEAIHRTHVCAND